MRRDAPGSVRTGSIRSPRAVRLGRISIGQAVIAWLFTFHILIAHAASDQRNFDIPAQPLSDALFAFSAATGVEFLVEARHAAGLRSGGVQGVMAPRDALEILLAGSKLVAQDFGPDTVTLKPVVPAPTEASSGGTTGFERPYFAAVQRAVRQALCNNARTLPGRYRLALKLWIGRSGTVLLSKRLDSTGDNALDATLDATMQGIWIGQPPPDLPQPVTLLISPRPAHEADECPSRAPDLRRASNR